MANTDRNEIKALPIVPRRRLLIRFLDGLVDFFPRRLFSFLRIREQSKFFSHLFLLQKELPAPQKIEFQEVHEFDVADDVVLNDIFQSSEALPLHVYQNRLAQGDICLYLKVDGEIVSFNWVSFNRCCVFCGFEKGVSFRSLSPHQAFTYDFYTFKRSRKNGYGMALKQYLLNYLARIGIKTLYCCVVPINRASLNMHLRLGFTFVSLISVYRIMNWSTSITGAKEENRAARDGIAACKQKLQTTS